MPNWVKTRLTFDGISDKRFEEITEKYTKRVEKFNDSRVLDFECIIPMPKNVYRGNLGVREREAYGEKNWYDWSIKNWGTKWNASDGYIDESTHRIEFSTAWSFAEPVIRMLAVKTGCKIDALYADEDFGQNCGHVVFSPDGDIDDFGIVSESDDAWEIVEELWGVTREEMEEE